MVDAKLFEKFLNAIILNDKLNVIRLIKRGVAINHSEEYIKFTPLHYAASIRDSYETSLILLGAGANVCALNVDGETPGDIAERCGNQLLLSLLRQLEKYKEK